jgi:hypothetical protein
LDKNTKIKIEHEISRIDKQISDAKPLLDLCKIKEPDFVEITAIAQILHSFYNGVESVIVLIFKNINEKLPNDIHWHKTLFEMALGNNSKNIILINNDIKDKMEDYLSFRHFIRHSYSSELEWNQMELMELLANELEEIWKTIKEGFNNIINNCESPSIA